jgi:hypothetical protein
VKVDGTTGSDIDVEKDLKVSSGNSRNETMGEQSSYSVSGDQI